MGQDIVERLRDADKRGVAPPQNWTTVAADEIESLRAQLAECQRELHAKMVEYDKLWDEAADIRKERDELKYILAPINESKEKAEALGRRVDEWVSYAKGLEIDAPGFIGSENARLRSRNLGLEARIAELVEALHWSWQELMSWSEIEYPELKEIRYRTDNTEALDAYRDQVVEECVRPVLNRCIGFADDDADLNSLVAEIRALKKGKA